LIWHRIVPVEFNHCDPAGIVFYPRYFEMTNSVIENFFGEVMHYPYARMVMLERCGTPTVRIEADFRAPSRLGDRLDFSLEVRKVGRTSVNFRLEAQAGGELKLTADLVLVWVTADLTPQPWPQVLQDGLTGFMSAP
jgi:4-hydroxybenzoyl-CoA thioesterase